MNSVSAPGVSIADYHPGFVDQFHEAGITSIPDGSISTTQVNGSAWGHWRSRAITYTSSTNSSTGVNSAEISYYASGEKTCPEGFKKTYPVMGDSVTQCTANL